MSRLIKKLMQTPIFRKSAETSENTEIEGSVNVDMDEWKGWDAWVDIKK